MATANAQIWKSSNLSVERRSGPESGTVVIALTGPLTARDVYSSVSPRVFRSVLEPQADEGRPEAQIIDISGVPYVDSAGLGLIVQHFAWCRSNGVRMTVVGAGKRVLEQFRLMKMDGLIPISGQE
jgi:anti-anti-sigma factor